jgi:hypothetical protein
MRDLFFKTTRARHPSKKIRFVYNFLRLHRNINFVRRPRTSNSSFARFQVLRKMFMWFYTDRFLRKHLLKRVMKAHITGYGKFLSFCTKLEMLAPVLLYRLHYTRHLKEGFLAIRQGLVFKNGERIKSILHVIQPGDFIEFPYHGQFIGLIRSIFIDNLKFLKSAFVKRKRWAIWLSALLPRGSAATDSLFLSYANSTPILKKTFAVIPYGEIDYPTFTRNYFFLMPINFLSYYLHYKTPARELTYFFWSSKEKRGYSCYTIINDVKLFGQPEQSIFGFEGDDKRKRLFNSTAAKRDQPLKEKLTNGQFYYHIFADFVGLRQFWFEPLNASIR